MTNTDSTESPALTEGSTRDSVAVARQFLDHFLGAEDGFVRTATNDRLQGRDGWWERPARRYTGPDDLLDWARKNDAARFDVYLNPRIRATTDRGKNTILNRRLFHCEIDTPNEQVAETVEALHLTVVESGTAAHVHLYGTLDEDADTAVLEAFGKALGTKLGQLDAGKQDAKQAVNAMLRVPATRNHKHSPPTPVQVARLDTTPVAVATVAAELEVNLDALDTAPAGTGTDDPDGWLEARRGQKPCETVTDTVTKALTGLRNGAERHPTALHGVHCLLNLAAESHGGIPEALDELGEEFVDQVTRSRTDQRTEPVAREEFRRLWRDDIPKVTAVEHRDHHPDGHCWSTSELDEHEADAKMAGWIGIDLDTQARALEAVQAAHGVKAALRLHRGRNGTVTMLDATTGKTVIDADRTVLPVGTKPAPEDGTTSSWKPKDPTAILAGTYTRPAGALLYRQDGVGLFYPGKLHWLYGEPESGKSWIFLLAVVAAIEAGLDVAYIDYEDDHAEVINRLRALGASDEAIRLHFDYVQPETGPDAGFEELCAKPYTLIGIDAVAESMGTCGKATIDNDDTAQWTATVAKRLARSTGAAVVCVDHVSKSRDNRGRFAIGAQHKLAGLDGAAYIAEMVHPVMPNAEGSVSLRVVKDRPGGIRPASGPWRQHDQSQETAYLVFDATGPDGMVVTIWPWRDPQSPEVRAEDEVNHLMRLLDELEVARTAGRPTCKSALTVRDPDMRIGTDQLAEAVRRRKAGHLPADEGGDSAD